MRRPSRSRDHILSQWEAEVCRMTCCYQVIVSQPVSCASCLSCLGSTLQVFYNVPTESWEPSTSTSTGGSQQGWQVLDPVRSSLSPIPQSELDRGCHFNPDGGHPPTTYPITPLFRIRWDKTFYCIEIFLNGCPRAVDNSFKLNQEIVLGLDFICISVIFQFYTDYFVFFLCS